MKKINEEFSCVECGYEVPLADRTCRNHCPKCFTSLHVDGDVPGDRAAECGGKMYPKEYVIANGEIKILFECIKCGKQHHNKAAQDDDIANLDNLIYKYKRFFI